MPAPDSTDLFDNYEYEMLNEPRMAEPTEEPTGVIATLREYHAIMAEVKENQQQNIE